MPYISSGIAPRTDEQAEVCSVNCPITIENTASWYDQTPVFAQTCKTYAPGGCPGNLNGRYGR